MSQPTPRPSPPGGSTEAAGPAPARPARTPWTTRTWVVLALVGAVGGLLSGAFGVGGGIIMVPLLLTFAGMDQRRAATTSLAAIIPTAVAGGATYLANGEIDVPVAALVAFGGIVGSYVGARVLRRISLGWLRWSFVALLLGVAARLLLIAPERGVEVDIDARVALALVGTGLVMGVASGLFGIGGGVFLVPILISVFGASDLSAKGTSLLVVLATSVVGTVTNLRGGMVDLRAGAVVGLAATLTSFAGVALAFALPPRLSGVLFAVLLVFSAVQIALRARRARRAA
ncbi:sulfite exporter TauE/SafE family protein [Cellulomonas aerilata]|uniref:Probable membrane transporter protein n=1 Tax=Cellulomonas aerilata TaxID=515326 RepID=A0A512DBH3_9CELL|nr:sulfite exporter TauE/SafE family protein [Cellulomonas aerilata]GEO33816.1 UPF0721 transmembrane protein [Cellulomonas aerilata]